FSCACERACPRASAWKTQERGSFGRADLASIPPDVKLSQLVFLIGFSAWLWLAAYLLSLIRPGPEKRKSLCAVHGRIFEKVLCLAEVQSAHLTCPFLWHVQFHSGAGRNLPIELPVLLKLFLDYRNPKNLINHCLCRQCQKISLIPILLNKLFSCSYRI